PLCVQRGSGLPVQRAAPGRRAGDSGVERRQRVTERLGRPYLQSKQNDDGGMTVVRLIDLAHEDVPECTLVRLHVLEHRVLVGGRKILERRAVSPPALESDQPNALDEHPAGAWRCARDTVEMVLQVEVAGSGKVTARRDQAIQRGPEQRDLRIGKGPGHHRFLAFSLTWSAIRNAIAWIVDVGLTAPPVTITLPSIRYRFFTSWLFPNPS